MESTKERNRKIYEEYLRGGVTQSELAEKYGLSTARITQLVKDGKEREIEEQSVIYQLLKPVCEDNKLITKIMTVLKRKGLDNVEDFMSLDKKKMKKLWYFGPIMEDIVIRAQEEYKKKDV